MLRAAGATAGFLLGGILAGGLVGNRLHAVVAPASAALGLGLSALAALLLASGGGALWGRALGRMAGAAQLRRVTWAGALGFGPPVILAGLVLAGFERLLVVQMRVALPLHHLFTVLFVPATLGVAAAGAYALGLGLRDRPLAIRLAGRSGGAAGVAFLAVDLLMDAAGWRVGAPGAAERATMITVAATGALAAALVAGAVLGRMLARRPAV